MRPRRRDVLRGLLGTGALVMLGIPVPELEGPVAPYAGCADPRVSAKLAELLAYTMSREYELRTALLDPLRSPSPVAVAAFTIDTAVAITRGLAGGEYDYTPLEAYTGVDRIRVSALRVGGEDLLGDAV